MKISKLIIPFLSLAALLSSCAQEEIGAYYADVKVEPSYVSLPGEGGSKEIVLTTTDSWTITNIPEWLTVEPAEGVASPKGVKVTLSALKTYESHTAELSVNVRNVSQTVTVSQSLGAEMVITSVKDFIESGVDGRTYYLQGIVKNINNTLYGNYYLNDGTSDDDAYIYGMLDASGAEKNFLSLGIEEGDEIIISGPRTTYGTTIEIVNASLVEIVKKALLTAEKSSFIVTKDAGEVKVPVSVKGDDLTVSTPSADWLRFKGTEGSGEKTKVIMEYAENTGSESREATFTLKTVKKADKDDKDAKDIVSELNITVMQMPKFPDAKKVADIDYKGKEFATVEGQVVALSTKGVVICDGSSNEINKVYVEVDGFKYEDYAIGAKVKAVGSAANSYALNSITADYFEVVEATGEYKHPDAVEVTSANSNTIINQSPAKYGYLKASGYVSSSNNVIISDAKESISAVDAINPLALKAFSGKYVNVYGYNSNNNTSKNQIQLVLVDVEEVEDAPAFFEVPVTSDELDWNENSVEFEVIANQKWTAAITKSVEGVLISKKEGDKTSKIEVLFSENNRSYEEQTVVVTVTCGEKTADFTVTRGAMSLAFDLDKTEYTNQAREIVVKIQASKYWKVSVDKSEAKLDKNEGMGDDAVILTLPENKSGQDIVYTLTLTEDRVKGEPRTATLAIKHLAIAGVQTEGEGTKDSPYTAKDILDMYAAKLYDGAKEIHVAGIISNVKSVDTGSYGNAEYYISADGTSTNELYIYRGYYLNGDKFTDADQIRVGDKVLVSGFIGEYKGAVQLAQGSKIVNIERAEVKFDVEPKSFELAKEAGEFTVNLLCKYDSFEVNPSADWITMKSMSKGAEAGSYVVTFSYAENTLGARTATVDFVANGETISVEVLQLGAKPDTVGEGTLESPYTVDDALALINSGCYDNTVDVYIAGTISKIDEVSVSYGNAGYYISADGTEANQLQVYRGKYLNGEKFTSEDQIKIGDELVILGKLSAYNGKPQVAQNSQIISQEAGYVYAGKGTVDSPYTPLDALTLIGKNLNDNTVDVYIAGTISKIDEVSVSYGNAGYYISADGTEANQLQVYRGKYLNGEKFTSEDQIKVGDKVVILGKLDAYKGNPQVAQNSQIVTLESVGGGEETPELTVDGKQWLANMGGVELLVDLGATEENMLIAVMATDEGAEIAAMGAYVVNATDATSGSIVFTPMDPETEEFGAPMALPYTGLTETSLSVTSEELFGVADAIPFEKAEEYIDLEELLGGGEGGGDVTENSIENGAYWIVTGNKVATPVAEGTKYDYLGSEDMIDGASYAKNAFTFTYNADESKYTIQDSYGRYLYGSGTYNNFNVSADLPAKGAYWSVIANGDGTYDIYNGESGFSISYSEDKNHWEQRHPEKDASFSGVYPTLVKADNPVAEPEPPQVDEVIKIADVITAMGWTENFNLPSGTPLPLNENFTITYTKVNNNSNSNFHVGDKGLRWYKSDIIKVTSAKALARIEFITYGGDKYKLPLTSDKEAMDETGLVWSGDASEISFTAAEGQVRISEVRITYKK